jgi:rare lipoprotein A
MIFKSVYVTLFLALSNLTTPSSDEKANSGTASFYAKKFEGKRTSSGQRYRSTERTAAHRTYPFGTLLEITNHDNGLKTVVRVNDRGPHARTRLIDLSYSAAKDLGLISSGTADVTLKVISLGKLSDVQEIEDENEIKEDANEITTASLFPKFKSDFLEKKHQYMNVVKQADGSAKVVYSDVRQK